MGAEKARKSTVRAIKIRSRIKSKVPCKIQNKIPNNIRKCIYRSLCRAAGFVLCILLAGCQGTDRAITLSVGEPLEMTGRDASGQESVQQLLPDNGQKSEYVPRTQTQAQEDASVIYVHVCGAVKNPGVVMLPEGSRGQDALEAAGGFAEDAAKEAVNLAAVLSDGMRLYFPTPEEALEAESEAQDRDAGLVDINTAGVELLCTLPGIGETRAGAIVAYREEHGDFGSAEEIMRVSGIKEGAFNKIRNLITVK